MPSEGIEWYQGLEAVSNRYEQALISTWREALAKAPDPNDVLFSKEDLVRHSELLTKLGYSSEEALNVKNSPDIIYTFRARADLPAEIVKQGHYALIGRGKGLYSFVRIARPNRFDVPPLVRSTLVRNAIPAWVLQYLTDDEQSMLTSIEANDLVRTHLKLKSAFQLQSHLRMGVANYGQVEIDALYIGERKEGGHVGIAIEGKDRSDSDRFNVSQLFGSMQALRQMFRGLELRQLGAKPASDGSILMCEFTVAAHPKDLAEAGEWHRYMLDVS